MKTKNGTPQWPALSIGFVVGDFCVDLRRVSRDAPLNFGCIERIRTAEGEVETAMNAITKLPLADKPG